MTVERVAILCAGGHGREVLDILLEMRAAGSGPKIAGFVDEDPRLQDGRIDGLPVLGDLDWLESTDRDGLGIVCASGNPRVTKGLVRRVDDIGVEWVSAVSPRAFVSPRARLGRGVMLFANAAVHTGAVVGDHTILNVGATVSHDSAVGAFCNLNPGAHVAGNTRIAEGCYLGMGANVIQQVTVGVWATIGAGAAVIADIPPHVTAVGVPARVLPARRVTDTGTSA